MTTSPVEISPQGLADGIAGLFREFYMEIVAVGVPGACFFIFAVPAMGVSTADVLHDMTSHHYADLMLTGIGEHSGIAFFCALILSYLVGHLLFRRDPKNPDTASILALPLDDRQHRCVRRMGDGREEFPYADLRAYLADRGFDHLLPYVTWGDESRDGDGAGGDGDGFRVDSLFRRLIRAMRQGVLRMPLIGPRLVKPEALATPMAVKRHTKQYINRLKLRIHYFHPRIHFEISRNETHVRLISSLWYLADTIKWMAVIGFALGIVANWHAAGRLALAFENGRLSHGEALIYPALTFIAAVIFKRSIRRFFHYQRRREIVHVLEAYWLVDHFQPGGAAKSPDQSVVGSG